MADSNAELSLAYGPPDCVARYKLYPITVDVLGSHDNATVWLDGCAPVPLKACERDASEALLVNDTFPEEEPAAGGVKVTVYWAVVPAGTVTGNVIPLTAYPDPFHAADETTTSEPVADKVPVNTELLPTATLPKFNVAGVTDSVPALLPLGA